METEYLVAVIGVGGTLLGVLLSGLLNLVSGSQRERQARMKRRLTQAYLDLLAFYALESRYAETVARWQAEVGDDRTPEGVRRASRKWLRESEGMDISEDATPRVLRRRLQALGADVEGL